MKILIDFTQIPIARTGVGVYADHLLRELIALLGPADRLIVLAQDDDPTLADQLSRHAQVAALTIPARLFRRRLILLVFEQAILPWILFRHRVRVVHSLHYTHPLFAPCARAVTIHDLTFSLFPELHTRGRRLLFPFFTRRAMKRAECPVFVSESTRKDAERLFGACRYPGQVIPLGVDPPATLSLENSHTELARLGVVAPFLLFIGTLEPRKNIIRIIRAFEEIAARHPNLTLVIGGKLGWHTENIVSAIETSSFRGRIRYLGFVEETEKTALLSRCAAMVYPSLYEGFGLPLLEAMVCGAPVITSNISSMPEIAGDAALLIDPASTRALAAAMDRVLDDPGAAAKLQARGRERAAGFTWRATAEATYAAYKMLSETVYRKQSARKAPRE